MRKLLTIFGCVVLLSGGLWAQFTNPLVIQVQNAGSTIVTTSSFLRLNCSTNVTCAVSGGAVQITASATASSAFSGLTPGTNTNVGSFVFSGAGVALSAAAGATITATAAPWSGLTGFPTACTNQVVTAVGLTLTCNTLTSAYVNSSIAQTGVDINTSFQVTATHLASALPVVQGGSGAATLTGILKGNGTSAFSPAASADVIVLWSGTCSGTTFLRGDGACATPAGAGTVTSVAQTVPSGFAVGGTPITGAGVLAITYSVAASDQILISTGVNTAGFAAALTTCGDGTHAINYSASTHTFGCQTLTTGGAGTVTSVDETVPSWLTVTGNPITNSGVLAIAAATGQTAHQVIGTCGAATSFAPCALVAADIPTLNQSTTGSAATLTTARNIAGNSFNGSANITFANKFIVQGATDAGLSAAQFLGALTTGLLKNTTTTGILSIAASADVIADWSGTCSSTTFLRGDGACATPSGSGTVNAAAQFATPYYSAAGSASTLSGVAAPTANGQYSVGYNVVAGVAVQPTISLVGLSSRAVTSTTATDTILFSDNVHDVDYQGSVAVAVTLPTGTSLGNAAFVTRLTNAGSTTNAVTVTPTTWTINGASTLVIATGQSCAIKVDASGSAWDAICAETQLVAGTNITLTRTAFGLTVASTAAGPAFQVDATPLTSSATINYQDATAFNGLTIGFSNPSAGNVKLTLAGTLGNAGLTNSSITINGQTSTLGSTANVNVGATAHGVALNEGNGIAIAGTAVGATNTVLLGNTGANPSFGAVPNAALVNASITINGQTSTLGSTSNVNAGSTAHGVAINEGDGNAIASSAVGTAGNLFKSSGAGVDPVWDSTIVSNGTTFTYTGTGGIIAAGFGSTGSGGGYNYWGAGAENCVGAQPLNSICLEAPATVTTAYHIIMAGTPSTGIAHYVLSGVALTQSFSLIAIADLSATGTPSSTTFLRGDNTWAVPAGGGTPAFPITVTGGVSGAVVCFTSTTVEAAGGILNTNLVTKGGGAGVCPTNSLITDNGTTATYTGTGGYVAPVLTLSGTTATFMDFAQGTTSTAVAPCNTANSICEQAPTAVTSYLITKPGAAPTNNFSVATTSTAGVQSFSKMGQTVVLTGAAYTNATTGFTNVASTTNLNFAVDASTSYGGECYLVYSGSVSTAGPKIEFTGPASPTAVLYSAQFQITATPTYIDPAASTAFSTSLSAGTAVTASTNLAVRVQFSLVNGVNAGTLQLLAASQGVGTVTIQPGSYCSMQ